MSNISLLLGSMVAHALQVCGGAPLHDKPVDTMKDSLSHKALDMHTPSLALNATLDASNAIRAARLAATVSE